MALPEGTNAFQAPPPPQRAPVVPPQQFPVPKGYESEVDFYRSMELGRAEHEFMRKALTMSRGVDESMQAIQTFKRYQGMRRLAREIEGGTPLPQALQMNPDAWLSPTAAATLAGKHLAPPTGDDAFTPGKVVPIIDPNTGRTMLQTYQSGPRSLTQVPPKGGTVTPSNKLSAIRTELMAVEDDIDRLQSSAPDFESRKGSLDRRRTALLLELQQLRGGQPEEAAPQAPAPAAQAVAPPSQGIGPVSQSLTNAVWKYVPGRGLQR